MSIDLKNMSRKELTSLRGRIDKALEGLKKKEQKTALQAAAKAAAAHGFSLDELTGVAAPKAAKKKKAGPKTKAPAKYKNPADASQTWTGKGRQPQWFKDAMAAGSAPESLEI